MRGEDLNVVIRIRDRMTKPQQRLAALYGIERQWRGFVHARHQADVVGAKRQQNLGQSAAFAEAQKIRGRPAELHSAWRRDVLSPRPAHRVNRAVETERIARE